MNEENELPVTDEPVGFENNHLKFKASGKLPIFLKVFGQHTSINKEKPKDVNMSPVALGNIGI
jgi:hypothetical protein